MLDVTVQSLDDRQQLRPPVIDGEHVNGKRALQSGMLVEVIQDYIRVCIPFELDLNPGVLIGQIANIADVYDHLFLNQRGNPLDQLSSIDVKRDLGDDQCFPVLSSLLDGCLASDPDNSPTGLEVLANATGAVDGTTGGKVGSFDNLEQLVEAQRGIIDQRADAGDDFSQVVRRDVGCHPHGDTRTAIYQQVRERCRKDGRLLSGLVIIGNEIHRLPVHILHQDSAKVG